MIDIKIKYVNFKKTNVLKYKYKFRDMDYLVADKYGNFFILPHFNKRRTTEFKQLDSSKGYVYYNRNKITLSILRKRSFINYGEYLFYI